jgi:hypothetical protein
MSDVEKSPAEAVVQQAPVDQIEYPGPKKRMVIMGALFLSVFLVTLVFLFFTGKLEDVLTFVGSKHHINRNTQNH